MTVSEDLMRDQRRERRKCGMYVFWRRLPPFVFNNRGVLIHRVKTAVSIYAAATSGSYSHGHVDFWCGNGCNGHSGEDGNLTFYGADVPSDKIVCERCELAATLAGMKPADEICGRHVHVGRVRPFRTCCKPDEDN